MYGGGDGVSLRVVLGVVPLGVWFAITEHSPLRVARAGWSGSPSDRQCVPAGCSRVPPDGGCSVAGRGWVHCQAHTRASGRRLFRSRQGLGSLPGAHTSVQTALFRSRQGPGSLPGAHTSIRTTAVS